MSPDGFMLLELHLRVTRVLLLLLRRRDALQPLEGLRQLLAVPAPLALAIRARDEPEATANVVLLEKGVHGDDGRAVAVARVALRVVVPTYKSI